jgi:hypothetical protein
VCEVRSAAVHSELGLTYRSFSISLARGHVEMTQSNLLPCTSNKLCCCAPSHLAIKSGYPPTYFWNIPAVLTSRPQHLLIFPLRQSPSDNSPCNTNDTSTQCYRAKAHCNKCSDLRRYISCYQAKQDCRLVLQTDHSGEAGIRRCRRGVDPASPLVSSFSLFWMRG